MSEVVVCTDISDRDQPRSSPGYSHFPCYSQPGSWSAPSVLCLHNDGALATVLSLKPLKGLLHRRGLCQKSTCELFPIIYTLQDSYLHALSVGGSWERHVSVLFG